MWLKKAGKTIYSGAKRNAKKSEKSLKKVLTKEECFDILTERLRDGDPKSNKSVGSEKYLKKGIDKILKV